MTAGQLVLSTNSISIRVLAVIGIGAMLLGAVFVWFFDPSQAGFFPVCPLYRITGFACPGCGLTRGFHALFHGDILTALDYNALIPLVSLLLGYIFASLFSVVLRGKGLILANWNLIFLWVTLGVLITFGVLRNLPFYPFTILFP
ncbi:MAG: DUF2752 domain-containing protein [Pyrinomonadaceae bacterium]